MNQPDPYRLDRAELRRSFGRAAGSYDEAAPLQREIATRLLSRLDLIRIEPRMILDAGSGTGYCTRDLAHRYRRARVTGVDLAQPMAALARSRDRWWRRHRWVCGDIERLPFAGSTFDLVFSNLALQWCDPRAAFGEFRRVLRPGGLLLFTTFGPDTLMELRAAWAAADAAPHVHGFIDMHDLGDALLHEGFGDPVMDCERLVVTYADVPALLRDLKHIGAHNAAAGRRATLTGKRRFERFRAAYESQARERRIPASYETVYGHAWAPDTRDAQGTRDEGWKPVTLVKRGPPTHSPFKT